jgi:hypothetical protein
VNLAERGGEVRGGTLYFSYSCLEELMVATILARTCTSIHLTGEREKKKI